MRNNDWNQIIVTDLRSKNNRFNDCELFSILWSVCSVIFLLFLLFCVAKRWFKCVKPWLESDNCYTFLGNPDSSTKQCWPSAKHLFEETFHRIGSVRTAKPEFPLRISYLRYLAVRNNSANRIIVTGLQLKIIIVSTAVYCFRSHGSLCR